MIGVLRLARNIVTALIYACMGLAFLPHFAGARLVSAQKFLTSEIGRRSRGAV